MECIIRFIATGAYYSSEGAEMNALEKQFQFCPGDWVKGF